jgi:hypothetical protein
MTAARAVLLSIPSIPTANYQLRNSQCNSLLQLPTISLLSYSLSWPGVLSIHWPYPVTSNHT